MNQWKDTYEVLQWFSKIENKKSCSFVQMYIKDFYPSISREILDKALSCAKERVSISEKDTRAIYHCRRFILFSNSIPWKERTSADCFDDGAEICELVGLFILNQLSKFCHQRRRWALHRRLSYDLTQREEPRH